MPLPEDGLSWDLTPEQAIALQSELAPRVVARDGWEPLHTVGGIDVGVRHGMARAAVVVLTFPELGQIECRCLDRPVRFPYIPGLLSFRELPAVLETLAKLRTMPDILIVDGHGYAHPRRLGIASHLGVLLDVPTIGCAKSRLCGQYQEPVCERGARSPLTANQVVLGTVLRTRANVKPVFVSVGHRVSLDTAVDVVLRCCPRYRLPEPIRWAHRLASGSLP